MTDKQDWKHGKFFRPDNEDGPDAVAIFDDEDDSGCDAIYLRFGQRFSPCRTVDRSIHPHWENVLLAWACRAPLEDHRNDRSTPLP
jgi:hypothetical protein